MADTEKSSLNIVLELASQSIPEEVPDDQELAAKRSRQVEALKQVAKAIDEGKKTLDEVIDPPEERDVDLSSAEFQLAQQDYDQSRSEAETALYEIFSSVLR